MEKKFPLKKIFFAVIIGIIVCLLSLLFETLLVYSEKIHQNALIPFVAIFPGAFACSFITAVKSDRRKVPMALTAGVFFFIILLLISTCCFMEEFKISSIIAFLIIVVISSLMGGILGAFLKKKKKRINRRTCK